MTTQTTVKSNKGADFFKGVRSELKKVNWPNRADMIKYTSVVFIMCAMSTLFIWLVDSIFQYGLKLVM